MNSTGQQWNLFSASGGAAALLIFAAGLIFVTGEPLKTARPISDQRIAMPTLSDEWVKARLWQDPFIAVRKAVGALDVNSHAEVDSEAYHFPVQSGMDEKFRQSEFALALKKKCEGGTHPITVLGVMVFGGDYHEQIEYRIRARYATLSGLAQLDFVPDDAEHLGAIRVTQKGAVEDRLPPVIPYEWFQAEGTGSTKNLLVLWLLDEPFGNTPFSKLGHVLKLLETAGQAVDPNGMKTTEDSDPENGNCVIVNGGIKITGPAGSTTLRAMVKEAANIPKDPDGKPDMGSLHKRLKGLTIISPSATASDNAWLAIENEYQLPSTDNSKGSTPITDHAILEKLRQSGFDVAKLLKLDEGKLAKGPAATHKNIAWLFKQLGVTFQSTIGTDPVLMESLVEELKSRDVEVGNDHIAVISEWDTYYGRALPGGLKRFEGKEETTIHQFSYMRGIDGRIPGSKNDNSNGSDKNDQSADTSQGLPEAETGLQRPAGRTQIDYLERLASKLLQLNEDIKINNSEFRPFKPRGIRAIGVLGSDVYDKLLVVQALRPRFPNAVFFTTDLDAGFWHPDELKFTRNMIVSSNYGLELARDYYKKIKLPPFRDNYQTSRYLSTLTALGDTQSYNWKKIYPQIQPRIFEIGRRGPVDLSAGGKQLKSCGNKDPGGDLYPCPVMQRSHFGKVNTLIIIAVALFGLGFILSYRKIYCFMTDRNHYVLPLALAIAVIPIVIYVLAVYGQGHHSEPIGLLDGVSLWPAEAIRLVSGVVAVYLLIRASWQVREPEAYLEILFLQDASVNDSPGAFTPSSTKLGGAENLWEDYKNKSAMRARLIRVVFLCGIYILFAVAIMHVLGLPKVPYRGGFSAGLDIIVTIVFSVIPLLLLLFFVLDATKLASWLTRRLSALQLNWSAVTIERLHELHGISAPSAAGQATAVPGDWITINVIARLTESVGRLVYYPAIVMFLMFCSRVSFFDNWPMSAGLLVVMLIGAGWIVYCALCLRRAAEQARWKALQRLELLILDGKRAGTAGADVVNIREYVQQSIKSIATGAFLPIPQQPWLRTLLFLFGGGGGFLLLEYLVWVK